MRFAVCEKNSAYARHMISVLEGVRNGTGAWYPSGSSLGRALERGDQLDLLVLDLEMPDISPGIAIRIVRRYLPQIALVATASDPRRVTEAFMLDGVQQFFVKPIDAPEVFRREIGRILDSRPETCKPWCLHVQNCLYRVNPQDVICIEGYYRHLTVYAGDRAFELPGRMSEAVKRLKGCGFYPCHQRYLVNLRCIQDICGNKLLCRGGRQVPVSCRRRSGLLRAYAQFKLHAGQPEPSEPAAGRRALQSRRGYSRIEPKRLRKTPAGDSAAPGSDAAGKRGGCL